MLTSKDRSILKSAATKIPDMQLGKGTISDNFIKSVKQGLLAHEIVKVSVLKNAGSPLDFAEETARLTDSEVVTIIGSKFILYKKSPRVKEHLLGGEVKKPKNTSTGKQLGGNKTKYLDRQSKPLYDERPRTSTRSTTRTTSHGVSKTTARGIEGKGATRPTTPRGKRRTSETGRV